jgi:hypothetical protein
MEAIRRQPLKLIKNEYGNQLILHPNGDTTLVRKGDQIGIGVFTLPFWFWGTLPAVLHDHGYDAQGGGPQEVRFRVDRELWLNWIAESNSLPWYETIVSLPLTFLGKFIVMALGGVLAWNRHDPIEFDTPKYGLKDSDIIETPETIEVVAIPERMLLAT